MEEQKKTLFMKISEVLQENASRFGLLLLFLLIFSWPYLSFLNHASPALLFKYFFIAWLLLVIVLFISNRHQEEDTHKKQ